ncbi:MAG: molybdenum cofactor guanylyltransferase MobA [Burkholderiales bacterium]|nr:molybdenum cofactor guanylyltransferase MobA [Burkholderiales bacterium]
MKIEKTNITGLILAGGRGTRMGSVDKGLQLFRGMPMAMHALMRLDSQVGQVLVNANQNLAAYESFGVPVVTDLHGGYSGPLAGLHAGLCACDTEFLVTVPCDVPLFPLNLVERLVLALEHEEADVAVAYTHSQAHPVFTLVRSNVCEHLDAFLKSGQRKIDIWYASLKVARVEFDEQADRFMNVNTIQELHELQLRTDLI